MSSQEPFTIEVVCATPRKQILIRLNVQPGTTARQAVDVAKLAREFPELDTSVLALGIYGEVVADSFVLQPGDRVEIYRPLVSEPREKRRLQVEKSRKASALNSKRRSPGA